MSKCTRSARENSFENRNKKFKKKDLNCNELDIFLKDSQDYSGSTMMVLPYSKNSAINLIKYVNILYRFFFSSDKYIFLY